MSKAQNQRIAMIEPLQENALQAIMEVSETHAKIKQILELSKEKTTKGISVQTLEEVVEHTHRANLLTIQAKEKVMQLAPPQLREG